MSIVARHKENLMEHEVMSAPIGAEAAGEQKQTIEKARTKIIDAAPLMERLKAAIAFGNEKGLPTDELEQVLADIEGMEELPPAQPKIIDGRLFVTVDDIKKVGCVLVDEHKSNFCRQFWMDGDGPAPCEDAVSRAWLLAEYDRQHQGPPGGARRIMEDAPSVTLPQGIDIDKASEEVLNAMSKWLTAQDDKRNVLDVIKDVLRPYKGKE